MTRHDPIQTHHFRPNISAIYDAGRNEMSAPMEVAPIMRPTILGSRPPTIIETNKEQKLSIISSKAETDGKLTFWQHKQSIDQTPVIPRPSRRREHERNPKVQSSQPWIFEPSLMRIIRQHLQGFNWRVGLRRRLHGYLSVGRRKANTSMGKQIIETIAPCIGCIGSLSFYSSPELKPRFVKNKGLSTFLAYSSYAAPPRAW